MRPHSRRAHERFALWQSSFERERAEAQRSGLLSGFPWRLDVIVLAALAVASLFVAVGWYWWAETETQRSEAASVLARSHQNERGIYQGTSLVHHRFQVEIAELQPQHR